MWLAAPTFSDSDRWVTSDGFPFEITMSHELAAEKRQLYYTDDGDDPTNESDLYDEDHIDVAAPPLSAPYGTLIEIKGIAWEPVREDYSPVASRKYWYDNVVIYRDSPGLGLDVGTIHSGAMAEMVVAAEEAEESLSLELTGGTIESGTYTAIVVSAPADSEEEKNLELTGGTIKQGKWWDPIVEIEPPWD